MKKLNEVRLSKEQVTQALTDYLNNSVLRDPIKIKDWRTVGNNDEEIAIDFLDAVGEA